MSGIKYEPVPHDHKAFLERASKRKGFQEAYNALEDEYALAREMLSAEQGDGQPTGRTGKRKLPRRIT